MNGVFIWILAECNSVLHLATASSEHLNVTPSQRRIVA